MILNDDEIKERIESPLNLLNRLKSSLNKAVHPTSPSLPPTADKLIEGLDDKLKNNSARSKANTILIAAMTELETRMPEIQKPETLAKIATEMSRVISSHDDNRRNQGNNIGQIIVYAPQVVSLDNFDIIDVTE